VLFQVSLRSTLQNTAEQLNPDSLTQPGPKTGAWSLDADFHSLRNTFITSLERADISLRMARTLARHSDIRLTLGVYTHVELSNQTTAIGALPGLLG